MQSSYEWILSSENLQEPRRVQSQGIPNGKPLGNLNRDPSVEKMGVLPPPTNGASDPSQQAVPSQAVLNGAPLSAVQPILPKPVVPAVASRPLVMEQTPVASSSAPSAAPSVPSVAPSVPSVAPSIPSAVPQNPPTPRNETHTPQENAIPVHFYVEDPSAKAENPNLFVDPDTGDRWIRCQNPFCGKWRYLPPEIDVPEGLWFCIMNTWDESVASCDCPQLEEASLPSKKKEVEKPWLPHLESHFEPILPSDY